MQMLQELASQMKKLQEDLNLNSQDINKKLDHVFSSLKKLKTICYLKVIVGQSSILKNQQEI